MRSQADAKIDITDLLAKRSDPKVLARLLAEFDGAVKELADLFSRRNWRLDCERGDVIQEGHMAAVKALREYVAERDGDLNAYVETAVQARFNEYASEIRREMSVAAGKRGLRLDQI